LHKDSLSYVKEESELVRCGYSITGDPSIARARNGHTIFR